MIKIIHALTAEEAGINAAEAVLEVIKEKRNPVLGLDTGSSPLGMYRELISRFKSGSVSFENVRTVNLDEYAGLAPDHPSSYRFFMDENLFNHIDIKKQNTHLPNGHTSNYKAECKRYDAVVASMGGIDLQVLGIGHNGHIGFNEPSSFFTSGTSYIKLTDSTRAANSRFFESEESVPTHAFSMGIGQIMSAQKILLIAIGKDKAEILERALFGPVTPEVPASILQFFKGDVLVSADEEALGEIIRKQSSRSAC